MCSYDANRFTGQALMDILCTHTHVLLGKVIHENPYYMSPAGYTRTALARRKTATPLTHLAILGGAAKG